MKMVLGLIEHDRGTLEPASLEMLTLARSLAAELDSPLRGILVGELARPLAERLGAYGVAEAYLIQHPRLQDYAPEAWARSVLELTESESPSVVMAAGTDRGNEVMAHVAARADLPLAANCTEVHPPSGSGPDPADATSGSAYRVTRLRWGGSLLEEAVLEGQPKLLTVAPHAVEAREARRAEDTALRSITVALEDQDFRAAVTGRDEAGERVSLEDARLVVGGGRGVGGPEGFELLEELAELLGGVVGASRVATNNGWRPHSDQIGQTGTRIAPELYIACGISGAVQHMVGCSGSKRVLAINRDPEAPILSRADYAAIGDLHEIVPALSAAIKSRTWGEGAEAQPVSGVRWANRNAEQTG